MKFDTIKKRSLLVTSILVLLWVAISVWLFLLPAKSKDWLINPIQEYISIPGWAILVVVALISLLFILIASGAAFVISSYIRTGSLKSDHVTKL